MKVDSLLRSTIYVGCFMAPRFALMLALLLCPTANAASPPAAFIQPDATTKQLPTSAFKITRGGQEISKETQIQPCDKVEFITSQTEVKKVIITTTKGGKNIVLDSRRDSVEISCEKVKLSEAAARVWKAISSGDRATSVPVATKGSRFELPIFTSSRSNLVAGTRALFITWAGGRPPFRVVLRRIASGEVLAKLEGLSVNSVRLPELHMRPGQYSLGVFNTPDDGSPPELREDNLFVVDVTELPQPPPELKGAKLNKAEEELLYCYFLEGLPNGHWVFEAMQRAAGIQDTVPAARDWLRSYGAGR